MRLFRPISISLSPNVQWDDVWLAIKILLTTPFPLFVRRGLPATQRLEQKFKEYLGTKYAFSFNSGRSALYIILKAMDIKKGDEVFLQAFACNAVPNPVLWTGGTPVYVDIDDTLNIDPEDLEKKITLRQAQGKRLRALIIQNTFGIPAQIDKILEIARKHNLMVIEDCAHALGARYNGKLVGTFGDVAFFSFGRDKVISSVWGGVVTTNNDKLARNANTLFQSTQSDHIQNDYDRSHSVYAPSKMWVMKQLLHPILFAIIIPTYYIFGKYLLVFLRVVRGVGLAVSQSERCGEKPDMFPARMPETLAELALHQFSKLTMYNRHRREIAGLYFEGLGYNVAMPPRVEGAIYLRFNIFIPSEVEGRHPNAKEIIKEAKKHHILLGDWYKNVIDPVGTDFSAMKYTPGSCPRAERAARASINLPTHINISKKDAKRTVYFLKNFKNKLNMGKSLGRTGG